MESNRLSATRLLDTKNSTTVLAGINAVIKELESYGGIQHRLLIWDTLEISVETNVTKSSTFTSINSHDISHTTISASVLGISNTENRGQQ